MGSRITNEDRHIGARVKTGRLIAGVSQEVLAGHLGVSFQQVQKYENGTNRISVGKLQTIAKVVNKPVLWFYGDEGAAPPIVPDFMSEFVTSKEGVALAKAFMRIDKMSLRRSIVAMVEQAAA